MARPLALPANQVTALCRGAAKAGFVAEVKIGDVVVRLVPNNGQSGEKPAPPVDDDEDIRL